MALGVTLFVAMLAFSTAKADLVQESFTGSSDSATAVVSDGPVVCRIIQMSVARSTTSVAIDCKKDRPGQISDGPNTGLSLKHPGYATAPLIYRAHIAEKTCYIARVEKLSDLSCP